MSFVISKMVSILIFAAWFVVGTLVIKGFERVLTASYEKAAIALKAKQS